MIGSYRSKLEGMNFSDRRQTSYLEALKYNAELIWEECNTPKQSLVNPDVLNTALLSLHPASLLKDKDISANTREALVDMRKFKRLILLDDYTKDDVQSWVEVTNTLNYSTQMVLMGWFLTLSSKVTGFKIPGAEKMLVGGRAQMTKKETKKHLSTMGAITQAMYKKNNWNFLAQYHILKGMHKDLKKIINKF